MTPRHWVASRVQAAKPFVVVPSVLAKSDDAFLAIQRVSASEPIILPEHHSLLMAPVVQPGKRVSTLVKVTREDDDDARRFGTVVKAVGKRMWEVVYDDGHRLVADAALAENAKGGSNKRRKTA